MLRICLAAAFALNFSISSTYAGAASTSAARSALDHFTEIEPHSGLPRIDAARYMKSPSCITVDPGWALSHPGFEKYAGFPVEQCIYPRSQTEAPSRHAATLIAVVWMLNADAERLSEWIGSTCEKILSTSGEDCGRRVAQFILNQNGAQYPIAGHVLETQSEAGCPQTTVGCEGDVLIYLPFRDGVTVTLSTDPEGERRKESFANKEEAVGAAEATLTTEPLRKVGDVGRISNISRRDAETDEAFLARNRDAYLTAWRSSTYEFLDEVARVVLK